LYTYGPRQKNSVNQKTFSLTEQLIRAKNAFHANESCDVSIINSLESQLSSLVSKEAEGVKKDLVRSGLKKVKSQLVIFLSGTKAC